MGSKKLSVALLTIVLSVLAATARPDQALASRGMLVGLYDLYLAEKEHTDAVASWLSIEPKEVQDAVAFESRLKAA